MNDGIKEGREEEREEIGRRVYMKEHQHIE